MTRRHPDPEAGAAPPADPARAYARRLAAASIADGDDTGWFETLYAAADRGDATVPWADLTPNPHVVAELAGSTGDGRALVIGCGLGDDAEHVASHGFTTVAFDVSPTAVAAARRRFPDSTVEYVTADLRSPPPPWAGAFDLVVEAYTPAAGGDQSGGPGDAGSPGVAGEHLEWLLVIARARDEHDDPGAMPWPLTRQELESFGDHGLVTDSIADVVDDEAGQPVRRWRAWFIRPPLPERLP